MSIIYRGILYAPVNVIYIYTYLYKYIFRFCESIRSAESFYSRLQTCNIAMSFTLFNIITNERGFSLQKQYAEGGRRTTFEPTPAFRKDRIAGRYYICSTALIQLPPLHMLRRQHTPTTQSWSELSSPLLTKLNCKKK